MGARHPGRADQQDLRAGVGQRPGQLREPQVVAALRVRNAEEALEVSRRHVGILHRTTFEGLVEAESKPRRLD
ncbi:hypothetical protein [Arthrobacter sp. Alg241-R88]|uniref:hypothetical protein n=1 Tax=Arthrobacter sp. Alg241-R88 TaxID=2305984 RepID=UPI0013D64032|nr:hypothetical protein [Arthrobacter sp. Alg241-R88]